MQLGNAVTLLLALLLSSIKIAMTSYSADDDQTPRRRNHAVDDELVAQSPTHRDSLPVVATDSTRSGSSASGDVNQQDSFESPIVTSSSWNSEEVVAAGCDYWSASSSSASGIDADYLYAGGSGDDQVAASDSASVVPGLEDDVKGTDVIVTTHYGRVRGKRVEGVAEAGGTWRAIDWFLGIPFAAPPVGNLRFKPPRAPRPWGELRNAVRYGSVCPQSVDYRRYARASLQDEDCLYLNVFAPPESPKGTNTSQALHAVMVYMHGGSYRVGSYRVGSYRVGSGSAYAGNILAQHDVIVVTINYRLGALGFLSARHSSLEGNYGLYDQIEALHWIQLNIRAFGGDPNRVTIFGNSAGGSSVGLLALSPLANGLFHQAIVQSGSPLAFWAVHDEKTDLDEYARQLASHVACSADLLEDLVACLRMVDWRILTNVVNCQMPKLTPSATDCRPVVDGRLLPDFPRNLLVAGRIKIRPIMTGVVTEEWTRHIGLFLDDLYSNRPELDYNFHDGMEESTFQEAVDHVMWTCFGYDRTVSKIVQHEYTNWRQRDDPVELRRQYINLISDVAMLSPTVELAEYFSGLNGPVYLYAFNHHRNSAESGFQDWQSNYHEMELNYLFGSPFTGFSTETGNMEKFDAEVDGRISRTVMGLWSNFARYGNPSGKSSTRALDLPPNDVMLPTWTRFTTYAADFLLICHPMTSCCRRGRVSQLPPPTSS